jgi:transposase
MRPHPRAKGNPYQRRLFIRRVTEEGMPVGEACEMAGWSERTGYKWLRRWKEEGEAGLLDRRSGPRAVRNRTPRRRVERILALRRRRQTSWEIAQRVGMPWSTVAGILKREGLGKLSLLEPKEVPRRYERETEGELVHFDVTSSCTSTSSPSAAGAKGPAIAPRATGEAAIEGRAGSSPT